MNLSKLFCSLTFAIHSLFLVGLSHAQTENPNIVFINLDDADTNLLSDDMLARYYPNMHKLATGGIRFENLHVTTPLCGPSRACLMTGSYAFNNGVKVNQPNFHRNNGFTGGIEEFILRGHKENDLGQWVKSAGYTTMHVGKYHHAGFDYVVPSGWDEFRATLGTRYLGTSRFSNELNPLGSAFGNAQDAYVTDVNSSDAVNLIHRHAESGSTNPFFLHVAPIAPHHPFGPLETMVPPNYADFASAEQIPRDPDFDEADTSDKPPHLGLLPLTDLQIENLEARHLARVRAMKSVDDMVGNIVEALQESNADDNTYIFLTSDNGFQLGHHRMRFKTDPFDRTTCAPLIVTGPGISGGQTANHLLAHIDICPTILELTGANIPDTVDGKSFAPLLSNPEDFEPREWQDSVMIENWSDKSSFNGEFVLGAYTALRFYDSIYVTWANGEKEFYSLSTDPYQLDNIYPVLASAEQEMLDATMSNFRTTNPIPLLTLEENPEEYAMSRIFRARGYIEDDRGVNTVGITVTSFATGKFFNGETWQDDWAQFFTNPDNDHGLISTWSMERFIESPPGRDFDFLLISARPFDVDRNFPRSVVQQVRLIEVVPPIAEIDSALRGKVFTGSQQLNGTYEENYLIDTVRVVLLDSVTRQYWNGIELVDEWSFLEAQTTETGDWELNTELPSGRFRMSARAIDVAGNIQPKAASTWFEVSN